MATIRDIALGVVGWHAGEERYVDFIAPIEPKSMRVAMARMSGCALVARGVLRAAGVQAPELAAPYCVGHAVSDVVAIGRRLGVWFGPDTRPQVGDLVLVGRAPVSGETTSAGAARVMSWGGTEHVLIVVDSDTRYVTSVDGGQIVSGHQCVTRNTRTLRVMGSTVWIGYRRVAGLLRTASLGL